MATFKFGRYIDIHWNGYDIQGPADTVFSIPDQLYEEFDSDIAPVEPTLVWIDTNEFQTLKDNVPSYATIATSPISIATSTNTAGLTTKTWSLNASYATDTHLHTGVYQPSGNYSSTTHDHTGTYQPAGTYVNSVIGTSPASVATSSGTATVSISSGTASSGTVLTANGSGGVSFQPSTGGISSLVGTTPVSATVVGSSATVSLNSGTNPNGYLMAADGSGGVIFTPASTSGLTSVVGVSPISSVVSGGTVSVSLSANYQTAGTYVTSVIGTTPISATGTTAITVSVDQAALTVAAASNAETLRTYVKNSSGSTINKGQVVYVTGSDGTNALIGLSTASTEAGSSKTLGIAANTMTNNAFGYVIENGQLSGIDTSATTAGASAWLGNTPGSLVFGAPPAEPSHSVYLGVVTKANASTGEILVKVQNGYELDELHDVSAASPTDLDILQYKSSSSLWTKASIANAGIAASSHTHDYQASGTYVNAVIGTSPATVSTASGTSTVSIIASSINSTHIADNAIVASKINAGAVNTAKIDSTGGSNGWVLTANGSGAATFAAVTAGISAGTLTAKGTLIGASAASTPATIPVGTDGYILTARSTATAGIEWSTIGTIAFSTYTVASSLALTDQDKMVEGNSAGALTITIPPNSSVAFPVGAQVNILAVGAGQVTIAAGTGVTVNATPGLKLRTQWSSATAIKRATNTWVLVGDLSA